MLNRVALLDSMDASTFASLRQNLTGITDAEIDWRPHPAANSIRWIVGHLAWFEVWTHDAIGGDGRYLIDRGPRSFHDRPFASVMADFAADRDRCHRRMETLTARDLERRVSLFGREDLTILELLQTHTLHLSGHRFQVRYIRGAHSRAHGTQKAAFDPW